MAILDKLKSVGASLKGKVRDTFGEGEEPALDEEPGLEHPVAPPLDEPAARRALGVKDDASLGEVREAYRRLAREHFGRARREGPESAAARLLDRALESLELLEEALLPLGPLGGTATSPRGPAPPARKRATPRGP